MEPAGATVEHAGACLQPCGAGWSMPGSICIRLELSCSHVEPTEASLEPLEAAFGFIYFESVNFETIIYFEALCLCGRFMTIQS